MLYFGKKKKQSKHKNDIIKTRYLEKNGDVSSINNRNKKIKKKKSTKDHTNNIDPQWLQQELKRANIKRASILVNKYPKLALIILRYWIKEG